MASQIHLFHWIDYLVFTVVVLLSCSLGVYFGIQDKRRKRNTIEDFLLAGRTMSVLPVSLSLFVSWVSAVSILGDPVQVYYNGIMYWSICAGYCLALVPVAIWLAPRFHGMHLFSAFEFLERKYSKTLRVATSVAQGLAVGLYSGIVLYAPALFLAQVSGISVETSVVTMGVICIFYTTLGGMKAVLWADALQAGVMFVGLIFVVVRGVMVTGGMARVWNIAEQTGRFEVNFSASPFVGATVWTYFIGGFCDTFVSHVSSQPFIQRYGTLKTARDAKLAVFLTIPAFMAFVTMFALLGLVIVAYFNGCDPLTAGLIEKRDQLVPLIVSQLLHFLPGLSGLFMASIFCAALSSLSSFLNSLALTLLTDLVQPAYFRCRSKEMNMTMSVRLTKIFCVVLGLLFIVLALLLSVLKDASIFDMSRLITGCFAGPSAGLFLLGLYIPYAGKNGSVIGLLVGVAFLLWLVFGSTFTDLGSYGHSAVTLTTDNCGIFNVSLSEWDNISKNGNASSSMITGQSTESSLASSAHDVDTQMDSEGETVSGLTVMYRFSPMLYRALGMAITVLIATGIGMMSTFSKRKSNVDPYEKEQKIATESKF